MDISAFSKPLKSTLVLATLHQYLLLPNDPHTQAWLSLLTYLILSLSTLYIIRSLSPPTPLIIALLTTPLRLYLLIHTPHSPLTTLTSATVSSSLIVLASSVSNQPGWSRDTWILLILQLLTSVVRINVSDHTPLAFLMPRHEVVQSNFYHIMFLGLRYIGAVVLGLGVEFEVDREGGLSVGFGRRMGFRMGDEGERWVSGNAMVLVLVVAPIAFAVKGVV